MWHSMFDDSAQSVFAVCAKRKNYVLVFFWQLMFLSENKAFASRNLPHPFGFPIHSAERKSKGGPAMEPPLKFCVRQLRTVCLGYFTNTFLPFTI